MNKRTTILISIIILLVILVGLNISTLFPEQVEVGDVCFDIPNGYHQNNTNSLGDIALTNGSHAIYLAEYSDGNLTKYTDSYINEINRTGDEAKIMNLTIDGTTISKSSLKNNSANHYWFTHNNKVYSIYTWNENPKIDTIVIELIKSMKDK